jgi:hypothetical protein
MHPLLKVGEIYINRFDYSILGPGEGEHGEVVQILDNAPYVTASGICFKTKIVREGNYPAKNRKLGKVVLTNGDCISKQFKINKLKASLLYDVK